jgi:outer membrane lipoprotein-sorting protein
MKNLPIYSLPLTWLLLITLLAPRVQAQDDATGENAPLRQWINTLNTAETLQADFVQRREIKTFKNPLESQGTLSYEAPDKFRWEIAQPPSTAILTPEQVTIIYPNMERVEVISVERIESSKWRDTFELIRAGFPESMEDLRDHFRILSVRPVEEQEGLHLLRMELKKSRAGNPVREVQVAFNPGEAAPAQTALHFKDGSQVVTHFTASRVNVNLPQGTFTPEVPAAYKITRPLE